LIDACYDREQFPTLEEALEWTWASTTEEVEAVTFVLRKFFVVQDGLYVQQRIADELADYQGKAVTNKRIADEREANRRNASTVRDEKSTNRVPVVNEPPPNHEPLTINHKEEKKSAQAPSTFLLPEWINKGHWDAWHSCAKRKKATAAQKQLAVEKLDQWRLAGVDHAAALESAALAGWQGLFKPDDQKTMQTFAQIKADVSKTTITVNRDVEATEARVRADAAIPRNGPSLAVLAQMAAIRGHRLAS
jgi:uncharacterized protein YdaU (DUF1376 family)